jgi:hypothetical protein
MQRFVCSHCVLHQQSTTTAKHDQGKELKVCCKSDLIRGDGALLYVHVICLCCNPVRHLCILLLQLNLLLIRSTTLRLTARREQSQQLLTAAVTEHTH